MWKEFKSSLLMLLVLTFLTGGLYPLAVTGIAKLFFRARAEGSLIVSDGKIVGSALIGQNFNDPKFLWGRLSATSPAPYNAGASSGSNLGPQNPALLDSAKARLQALEAGPHPIGPVPVDLVTSSGSGLDPHLSPAAAEYQVPRIAQASGLTADQVRKVIADNTENRTFGVLGEPRVNVLKVNLSLARLFDRK